MLLLLGRRAGLFAAAAAAAVIGGSRMALDFHSLNEVLIGAAVGLGAVLALGSIWRGRLPRRDAILLLVLSGTLVVIGHGRHLMIEPGLRHLERTLAR